MAGMRRCCTIVIAMLGLAGCELYDDRGSKPVIDPVLSDAYNTHAVPDAGDPCDACRPDQLCVQRFDGVCDVPWTQCVTPTVDCPDFACTPACEAAYCPSPYRCEERFGCEHEPASPHAFTCYGP